MGFGTEIFFAEDCSKPLLWCSKIMLKPIFMWPDKTVLWKQKLFYWMAIWLCGFINSGLISYLVRYLKDFNKSLSTVSAMSTIFQTTVKITILYYHSESLEYILHTIWNEFWPTDLPRRSLKESIRNYYKNSIYFIIFITNSGLWFSLGFLISPFINSNREIPYKSIYPFDWRVSPVYEIICIIHCFVNGYLVNLAVIGFDVLFLSICFSLIVQYMLLGQLLLEFGTNTNVIDKLMELPKRHFTYKDCCSNRLYLILCIRHLQLLSRITQEVEKVFNLSAVLQLGSSVIAICVSSFIATTDDVSSTQLATMGSYLIGHLIQLFLYCAVGNILFDQSGHVNECVFSSNWYKMECIRCKKDVQLVIIRSQAPAKITAFKVMILNYQTFIKVMRLSFSFYTLLSNISK